MPAAGRRRQVVRDDLRPDAPEFYGVTDGGDPRHQREEHQRHDEHLQQADEQVANPTDGDARSLEQDAEEHARCEPD